jgi:hypothetical protein
MMMKDYLKNLENYARRKKKCAFSETSEKVDSNQEE